MILENTKTRILKYIEFKNISKPQFYSDIDIKRGLLDSDKMNGSVTDVVIAKILATYTDINPIWLLSGEGVMIHSRYYKDGNSVKESSVPYGKNHSSNEQVLIDLIEKKDKEIADLNKQIGRLEYQIEVLKLDQKNLDVGEDVGCADVG